MKKLILQLLVVLSLAGCKADGADDQRPVVTITSPTNGQVFTAGQKVTIVANISENDEIHMVHLHVINLANGEHALLFEEHPDSKIYTLNQSFIAQAGITYDITIEADDHSGNTGTSKVQVTGR